jgi:hypothetical protein
MVEGLYIRLFTRSPKQPLHTPTQSFVLVTRARAQRGARTDSLLTNLLAPEDPNTVRRRNTTSTPPTTTRKPDLPVASVTPWLALGTSPNNHNQRMASVINDFPILAVPTAAPIHLGARTTRVVALATMVRNVPLQMLGEQGDG